MKRLSMATRMVLCALSVFWLYGCGGVRIGLVTDTGSIQDRGFNESAWKGVESAGKTLSLKEGDGYRYVESKTAGDYAGNIDKLVADGVTIIVTVGFSLAEATLAAAKKYPNVRFVGVDQFRDPSDTSGPNYVGLIFDEAQAGYLAGILAGSLSKTKKIGGVYGLAIPPVIRFKQGYEQGAKSVDAAMTVFSIFHPAGDNAFVDAPWGAQQAQKFLTDGADVVFGAGGQTGNGALELFAGERTDKQKELFCIGVDVDQYETVKSARPCLVSSAVKKITEGVAELISKANAGSFPKGGNFTGKIGLAPFHDFDAKIEQAVKDKLTDAQKKLESGDIKVKVDLNTP
ncbi:BMP family ABC transporter substrate-binding protein [Myxococcota bacterium]|nr:BMP family ABC transporter substrate-binding protein [Myxococcota bacterium]